MNLWKEQKHLEITVHIIIWRDSKVVYIFHATMIFRKHEIFKKREQLKRTPLWHNKDFNEMQYYSI